MPYLTAYMTHGFVRRTLISAGRIKKKLVIRKIIIKWYCQVFIYEVWFWLNKPWLQLNEK